MAETPWIVFNGFEGSVVGMMLVTLLLLCMSAFVSGSETAFFSLSHKDLQSLKQRDSETADRIVGLLGDVDLLLATILVVNNLVNICITILTATIIDTLFVFHRFDFLFKTVLVTFLLLLFGEVLPKVFAQTSPGRFASFAVRPMTLLRSIFRPISMILVRTGNHISERASLRREISLDELADAVDMTQTESDEERVMLSGIVNFVNTEAAAIMKPRVDITAVELTDDYETVKRRIIDSGFSRIPVYDEDIDNIRGTLYVKDLVPHLNRGNEFGWQQLIRKPYFIPEHKKINDLLEDFQSNKVHMAIVVDEYGSTLGLVSLEDIIEEIIGEISDESDADEKLYTQLGPNTYLFEGKSHIVDFERILELDEDTFSDVRGEAETLAGMMLEIKRDFPRKGDSFMAHNLRFTVTEMENHRIDKIKVEVL
ncbi:MAG: gliding motility-associated protein GldE [Rikenellaceae bacterium]|nr:gliding motility-associated protein GldE [Rikenellaceae bacterium]